uniref:Glutaredoxin-C2 n=1 Tax=Salmo salar TaxID=8030 RepID=B9EME1_SALSA|nr:Glutaredoxin-C2 [Salmo salar]ACM08688.1 Glutaredoxin-C2 [Salmo salar]
MELEASLDAINKVIESNSVVVFSKSYCPFCVKAKNLLNDVYPKYIAYELNNMENGGKIQDLLMKKTNQKTVPNIFIGNEHIGGCDSLFKLNESGKLENMLKALP